MPRPDSDCGQTCGRCYFWEPHRDSLSGPSVGQCRYSPPIYTDGDCMGIEPVSPFPQTYETDWCGDWKAGEAYEREA